jgi:putative Holliday junction resolvase
METTRYLGLDIGTKRIGIAISDPLYITAQSLKTIQRLPEVQSIGEIENLCKEYQVFVIIVGLPKNMNGTLGTQAQDCVAFASKLEKKLGVKIVMEDERLTSKQAERMLAAQNKKYTKEKGLVDLVSAAIILQQFLDKRS